MSDKEDNFGDPGFNEFHNCPNCGAPCQCHINDIEDHCNHDCDKHVDYELTEDDLRFYETSERE